MTDRQTFQYTPVREAIVEVHAYIMFFLESLDFRVFAPLGALALWALHRRGYWWGASALGVFLYLARLAGPVGPLWWVTFPVGGWALGVRFGWVAPNRKWLAMGGVFFQSPPDEDGEFPPDEDEARVDQIERVLWVLLLGGAVVILAAVLAYWLWGGHPSDRVVDLVRPGRVEVRQGDASPVLSSPPRVLPHPPEGSVRALARLLARRLPPS